MSQVDAPLTAAMVDEIVTRVRSEVINDMRAVFGPRHDRIITEFTETKRDLAWVREELARASQERDELRKRLAELEERSGFVEALATHLGRLAANGKFPLELLAAITDETPRPPSIDRACATGPVEPAQRVDLPQYGWTVYPTPGSPPDVTWSSFQGLPGEGTVDDAQTTPDPHRTHRN